MFSSTTLTVIALFAVRSVSAVAVWGQCGGLTYTGEKTCDTGNACVYVNDYYSQCQPGSAATSTAATSTTAGSPTTTVSTTVPTTTGKVTLPATGYNQLSNFGSNPSNVGIYTYVPSGLTANPGIVVALHYCTGSASGYYSGTQWKALADSKKNFIVIYGDSPRSGKCWDVSTAPSLKHDGGSDSLGIVNAVRYGLTNWGANKAKVFVTGSSSGAMMTEVLLGAYPDIFVAGGAVAGVPYGCFATTDGSMWNSACAAGSVSKTGAQWGDLVRAADAGYTGTRPKVLLVHGTADTTLNYNNFKEAIKQWTNVFGISETATSTTQNDSESGTTHTKYGTGQVEAYSMSGATHDIAFNSVHETQQVAFFGL